MTFIKIPYSNIYVLKYEKLTESHKMDTSTCEHQSESEVNKDKSLLKPQ